MSRWHLRFYVALFASSPVLLFCLALLVVNTDWFASRKGMVYFANTGYGAKLHDADCDIVVYGDSTALIGVDPAVVHARTGLSTCNIAEIGIFTTVNGTREVDHYLRHNRAPRYLVFLFGTDSFDPQARRRYPPLTTFEAVTYRLREPGKAGNLAELMRHPEDVFTWFEHGLRAAALGAFSKPLPGDAQEERKRTRGQMASQSDVFASRLQTCNYTTHADRIDREWTSGLKTKYAHPGTTVLVDATPVPDCDATLNFYRQQLGGLVDNDFGPLPRQDFDSGGKHTNDQGTQILSTQIGDQIVARMRTQSSQEGR